MSRIEIEHLLEKAVAEALGVQLEDREHTSRRHRAIILKAPRLRRHAA